MKILVAGAHGRVGKKVMEELNLHQLFPVDQGSWSLPQPIDAAVLVVPWDQMEHAAARAVNEGARAIFGCTEDVDAALRIRKLYPKVHVEVQCGFAPGWIGDVARGMTHGLEVKSVELYAGALTPSANNEFLYWPTWCGEGLIREYQELCFIRKDGFVTAVNAQGGYQVVVAGGRTLEAFHTAGGLGELLYETRFPNAVYRTLRPVGHLEAVRKRGVGALRELPRYEGPEELVWMVTVVGTNEDDQRVVRSDSGVCHETVARATARHVCGRVESWINGGKA